MFNFACLKSFVLGFALGSALYVISKKNTPITPSDSGNHRPTIVIETMPDDGGYPYFRNFHFSSPISDRRYFGDDFRKGEPYRSMFGPIPTDVQQFVETLYAINGIDSVRMDCYELTINISKACTWDHIEPAVVNALKSHLGWTGNIVLERIEKHYSNCRHGG